MTSTRIERRRNQDLSRPQQTVGLPERVALFVGAIHGQRADELLEGFAPPHQARALAFVQDMKRWDSARRQARLAHEFGVRHDAGERIHALVVRTSGELRAAIVASLPPAVRAQFPQFTGGAETFPVAVRALAARLVKEASR
jgi:hypothetical protein